MHVIANALRAAVLAGALAALLSGGARAQVLINEVFTGTPDFIEVWNLGQSQVDLGGWQLATFSGANLTPDHPPFVFPAGTLVGGFDLLVVREGGTAGASPAPGVISTGQNYAFSSGGAVEAILTDDLGRTRDYVFRRAGTSLFNPHIPSGTSFLGVLAESGESIVRIRERDTNFAQDWAVLPSLPTEGALNPTQGFATTPFQRLMITEVSWRAADAIEIANLGASSQDLTGWRVRWHDGTLHTSAPLATIILPGQVIVVSEPGGPIVAPGTVSLPLLPNLTTEDEALVVALEDPNGIVVDEVRIRSGAGALPTADLGGFFTGAVTRSPDPSSGIERFWGLDSDTAEDWTEQPAPSFGLESRSSGTPGDAFFDSGLRITELAHGPELIEIRNGSASVRNLEHHFLLVSAGQGALTRTVWPFPQATNLAPGAFAVIGEGPVPPAEMPPGTLYVDLSSLDQFLPFSGEELAVSLHDLRGRPMDEVRATRRGSRLVHNDPRNPGCPLAFTGAALRAATGPDVIARTDLASDLDSGADWRATAVRTMGAPNAGFSGPAGLGGGFDVRVNATGAFQGLTVIMNAGAARAGFVHHLAFTTGHAFGQGPVLGLGPAAVANFEALLGVPPFSAPLDAEGSDRIDLPAGTFPPGVAADLVWLLQDPTTGAVVAITPVLSFDS